MNRLLFSAVIGVIAGFVDIVPMVFKKLKPTAIVSAFLQYFFVSIVILNLDLPGVVWWLQGALTAVALSLPIVILISENDRKSVPIVVSMAVILGTLIALAGHYFR